MECDKGENMKLEELLREDVALARTLKEKENQRSAGALSRQVGGSHYKEYEIQPYVFFFKNHIPHHKAAIIRRILRYDHPTGKGIEDLEKIIHECEMIMELEGWR
jgi:hypothetical protein